MIVLENALSDQFLRDSIAVRRYLAMFEAICQAAYGSDRSKEPLPGSFATHWT
jgi:hypothetical protein